MKDMQISRIFPQKPMPWNALCHWSMTLLISISILWRGGKSIDMTWILVGVATFLTITNYSKNKPSTKVQVPLIIWSSLLLFIICTVLSYIYSHTQNYGIDEVFRTVSLVLIFFWSLKRIPTLPLTRTLSITTLFACVAGLFVYVFQPVNRFTGTFFDYRFHTDYWPNAWAQFLLLSWPVVLYWSLRDFHFDHNSVRSRAEFLLRAVIMGFVIGCLMLSYSRGATLVFIAQLMLWASFVYIKTKKQFPIRKVVQVAVPIAACCAITFIVANNARSMLYEVQDVTEKVTLNAAEGTSSVSERFTFWGNALSLTLEKPLFGYGPYSFRFVQPTLQTSVLATSDHPHNVFLKFAMERGVITATLFIIALLCILMRSAKTLLGDTVEVGTLKFSLRMLTFLGVSGVILHNLIDYNLQFVGIALPFWLLLAVQCFYLDGTNWRAVPTSIAKWTEITIATLLFIAALYEGSFLVVSSLGRHAEATGDTTRALSWYEKAAGREWFSRDLHLSRAKLYFEQSEFDRSEQAIQDYFTVNTFDYRAWKRKGDVALLLGNKQEALEAYETALEGGKWNDIGVMQGVIEAHLALDDQEAIQSKKPIIDELIQAYAEAIAQNTHHIALSPNVEHFVVLCNTLARLFPDEAPKYQVLAARADHHAQIERQRIVSRPPGFLW